MKLTTTATSTWPMPAAGAAVSTCPAVALGLWHNFDGDRLSDRARRMLLNAFDHGINSLRSCQQLRTSAGIRRKEPGLAACPRSEALPRRVGHLDQGGI